MNELVLANRTADWRRLKALVLDSVSSPITKRVYNLALDEFIAWYAQEPRPSFTKATVAAWRVALEARGLGAVSINVRITAVRKLAVEAGDNGLLAPDLANGITRVKGVPSKGVRLGNWLTVKQAQALLNAPISRRRRDAATAPFLQRCWAADWGDLRWRPSRLGISSSATAGGALWTCLGSTVGSERSRCRLG